jgi:hypothetical protein
VKGCPVNGFKSKRYSNTSPPATAAVNGNRKTKSPLPLLSPSNSDLLQGKRNVTYYSSGLSDRLDQTQRLRLCDTEKHIICAPLAVRRRGEKSRFRKDELFFRFKKPQD